MNTATRPRASTLQRFWDKVDKSPWIPGQCWLWTAGLGPNGYGAFRRGTSIGGDRRMVVAHRLSYELVVGPIPAGLFALHHCDIRRCCNPEHLYIGTYADNSRDMAERGRGFSAHGEISNRSVLTDNAVRVIRRLADTALTQREVGAIFRISAVHAGRIQNRARWNHI